MAPPMTPQQRLVLVIAILGSFVAFLDGTIVNVALPAIARDLGGGLSTSSGRSTPTSSLGALILVAGAVSDAFGRILVLRIGLIGFGIASVAVALSPPRTPRRGARGAGSGRAFLVPSSLALITATMHEPLRSRAIGIWTASTTAAMIVGPLVGLIVDNSSWRWAFGINLLPIGVALWLLTRLTHRDERRAGAHVDVLGAIMCTLGLGAAVFALIEQPNLGWTSPAIWMPGLAGLVLLAGFVWRQRQFPIRSCPSISSAAATSPPATSRRCSSMPPCRSTASCSRSTCSRARASARPSPDSRVCRRHCS
jgi:MFS family permease